MWEAVAQSEVDPTAVDEELGDGNAAVLAPAPALVQCFVAALACRISSIAWVDNSPLLEIMSARCRKVGTFFGAMEHHCEMR
jgi:hypothetical protein